MDHKKMHLKRLGHQWPNRFSQQNQGTFTNDNARFHHLSATHFFAIKRGSLITIQNVKIGIFKR